MKTERKHFQLYAIAGGSHKTEEALRKAVEEAVMGGATMVQLREKESSDEDFLSKAKAVSAVCKRCCIPFIVNDRIDIAKKAGADGVHLGQEDGNVKEARALLGEDAIIGITAHNVAEALEAEAAGADYLGVGAAFGSGTKTEAKRIALDEYDRITGAVSIPVVAIGGIGPHNVEALFHRGLAGVAVISAIFEGGDVKNKTRILKDKLDQHFI